MEELPKTLGVRFGLDFSNKACLKWLEKEKERYIARGWKLIESEDSLGFVDPTDEWYNGWNKKNGQFICFPMQWAVNLRCQCPSETT